MRNQPPGFRWAVGGFALLAAIALALQWRSSGDRADLLLAVVCLLAAGYWLIFDRHPAENSDGADAGADVKADAGANADIDAECGSSDSS